MNNDKIYDERVALFETTIKHQEPKSVPVVALLQTYAISYANATIEECQQSHEKEFEIYSKVYRDIYFDAVMDFGISRAMKLYDALGSNSYFVSEDKTTLQHKEDCVMREEDYDELIKDPFSYITNTYLSLKFPSLRGTYEQKKTVLHNAALGMLDFADKNTKTVPYLKENLGLPILSGPVTVAPMDIIFDFLRGFTKTLGDLRRRPEKVKAAVEALTDFSIQIATSGAPQMPPFPFLYTPLHCVNYLSPKQFEEIYWPSYKKVLMDFYNRGGKVLSYLEGNWEKFYEFLQELPKDFFIGSFESDDIVKAKKKLGDKITICGGMPVDKLKYGTKQECLDHAKYIVDNCAPGGGYICTTNVTLLSKKDVNSNNFKAVNEFVHNYGI